MSASDRRLPKLVSVSLLMKAANMSAITGAKSLLPGSPIKRQISYSTFSTWHNRRMRGPGLRWAGANGPLRTQAALKIVAGTSP